MRIANIFSRLKRFILKTENYMDPVECYERIPRGSCHFFFDYIPLFLYKVNDGVWYQDPGGLALGIKKSGKFIHYSHK